MAVKQEEQHAVIRFQVRVPEDLNERVEAMASTRRRSKNSELLLALEDRCHEFEAGLAKAS